MGFLALEVPSPKILALLICGTLLIGPTLAWADSYEDDEEEESPTVGPEPDAEDEPDLQAGGLTAPAGLGDRPDPQSKVEQDLARSDRQDSGRGLEFGWLNGEIGFVAADLTVLGGADFLAPGDGSGGVGAVYGAGLGVRVLYFTLGARFRMTDVGAFAAWALGGEAGFKLPLGNLEPYATLGAGYAGVGGLAVSGSNPGGLAGVSGLDLRMGVGADYYFSDYFSLGAQLGGGLLFVSRPAQQAADFPMPPDDRYLSSASAIGAAFSASFLVGFHL